MSLISTGLYVFGVMALLGILIALLPAGTDYPFPPQVATMLTTVIGYGMMFNTILPIQELLWAMKNGMMIAFFSRLIWPSAMWIFRAITSAI